MFGRALVSVFEIVGLIGIDEAGGRMVAFELWD